MKTKTKPKKKRLNWRKIWKEFHKKTEFIHVTWYEEKILIAKLVEKERNNVTS